MVTYRIKPKLGDSDIKPLLKAAWSAGDDSSYEPVLARSLTYVCAYDGGELVGFVNVAWDGGIHAFLLDTAVHPAYRHQGIGTELVKRAAWEAKRKGCHCLHVDYEAHLEGFYKGCGFKATKAGLIDLPKLPISQALSG